jgi:hypothetical protein
MKHITRVTVARAELDLDAIWTAITAAINAITSLVGLFGNKE